MATATHTKTVKPGPKLAATNPMDAFTMSVPGVDVSAAFRDFADKTVAQARDTYAKFKTAAEDATGMVEDTYETAREGAFAIGVKALESAKVNTDASFALARDLFAVKTFAEAIELQTAFARKQFEAVTSQFKELQDLTQKVVADTAKPVTVQVEKSFKDIKVA